MMKRITMVSLGAYCQNSAALRKTLPTAQMLLAAFTLSGCFGYGFDNLAKVEPVTKVTEEVAIDLDSFKFPDESQIAFTAAKSDRKSRNELQSAILRRSERACEDHKASIYTNSAMFNVSTGFLTSVFAGAGSIVTGQTAANILSGAAALSNSTRSLVNEEIYQQMISSAIIAEINQNRKDFLNTIKTSRSGDIEVYTVEDAILDAERYNNLCSFYQGISSLVKKAGNNSKSHEYVIQSSRNLLKQEKKELQGELKIITDNISSLNQQDTDLKSTLERRIEIIVNRINQIDERLTTIDKFM